MKKTLFKLSIFRRNKGKVFLVCLILIIFLYYSSGYFFVYNNDAYVNANVIGVTSLVSGKVDHVFVTDNQYVKCGDKLFSISSTGAELEKKQAENTLERKKAQLDVIKTLIENLAKKQKKLKASNQITDQNYLRVLKKKRRALTLLEFQENAVSAARIMLEKARLNLSNTVIHASVDGYVNNLRLYPGDYAKSGEVLFGLIERSSWFVTANIKENDLPMVTEGKKVRVYISSYPWHLYHGAIVSVSRGVARSATTEKSALSFVKPVTSWIRYPYRVPVRIKLLDFPKDKTLHMGIDAKVIIL